MFAGSMLEGKDEGEEEYAEVEAVLRDSRLG